MSFGSMTRFGMVGCVERDHTVSAVMDMPGVSAISLNGGACRFGEGASLRQHVVAGRADLAGIGKPLARIADIHGVGAHARGGDLPPLRRGVVGGDDDARLLM